MSTTPPRKPGRIITFYSYKGGTGRSMALANVAWLLASSGARVLAIDWDLEAPGLHRYFEPFLTDYRPHQTKGVIDFVRAFASAAVSAPIAGEREDWYREYSNLLTYAIPTNWVFPGAGCLDFVPAGMQDSAYGVRVNSFDWQSFYDRLGGGILLEATKKSLRELYDFILVDSRTGVSDTAGVCTVQMPDEVVVFFTLNRQSIFGASAAAKSIFDLRQSPDGTPTVTIWPVPTRVDSAEKERLELALALARTRFSPVLRHLDPLEEESYWAESSVAYEPYYAYEEVLATFRDRARQPGSMLASMERLARRLKRGEIGSAEMVDQSRVEKGLAAFVSRTAVDYSDELSLIALEYEHVRRQLPAGSSRTELMTELIARVQLLGAHDSARAADEFSKKQGEGDRIVALALAHKDPQRHHIDLALNGISPMRTPFEQYHSLVLAEAVLPRLDPTATARLRSAVSYEIGKSITEEDSSRLYLAQRLLAGVDRGGRKRTGWRRSTAAIVANISGYSIDLIEILPSSPHIFYEDVDENHGPYVSTRGPHALTLPRRMRIAKYLVSNLMFRNFVVAGGYHEARFWCGAPPGRLFLTEDGSSHGPGHWPAAHTIPAGLELHPVTSISFMEAAAFVRWCNDRFPPEPPWCWSLIPEDHWEYVARAELGLVYPWGDSFESSRCNSAESGFGTTVEVTRFESGASPFGCCDMTGNVWEFVAADDNDARFCVLRGGSFTNTRFEVRSYLRLTHVPISHRPSDFGFRICQVEANEGEQHEQHT